MNWPFETGVTPAHDCPDVEFEPSVIRLRCRVCIRRVGKHEPSGVRLLAKVGLIDRVRRGPGFLGGYDLEDTAGVGIGECGFPGCRCVETNRRGA